MLELKGQSALVTGAARRLGRSISLALAGEGVNLLVHYRSSREEAEELVREIRDTGVQAWPLQADLEQSAQVRALWEEGRRLAERIGGGIDILVNNASIFPEDRLSDLQPEILYWSLNINSLAPVLLARALAGQDRPAQVVNMLDARITAYDRKHLSYHLSKHLLHSLSRMTALELVPILRVNAVAPGLILAPPELEPAEAERYLGDLAENNPLRKRGRTEDVVRAVLFLLKNAFITGQVIYVDGGRSLKDCMYG